MIRKEEKKKKKKSQTNLLTHKSPKKSRIKENENVNKETNQSETIKGHTKIKSNLKRKDEEKPVIQDIDYYNCSSI